MTTQTISHWSADSPDRYRNDTLHGNCPMCGFALAQDDAGDFYCPDCGLAVPVAVVEARQRIAELEEALQRLASASQAVIDHPCEVNWTALQYNFHGAQVVLARRTNDEP